MATPYFDILKMIVFCIFFPFSSSSAGLNQVEFSQPFLVLHLHENTRTVLPVPLALEQGKNEERFRKVSKCLSDMRGF
jgi:hypothetical protein